MEGQREKDHGFNGASLRDRWNRTSQDVRCAARNARLVPPLGAHARGPLPVPGRDPRRRRRVPRRSSAPDALRRTRGRTRAGPSASACRRSTAAATNAARRPTACVRCRRSRSADGFRAKADDDSLIAVRSTASRFAPARARAFVPRPVGEPLRDAANGGCCHQISGCVIERLHRKRKRPVGLLPAHAGVRDACAHLHEAVETAPIPPRSRPTIRVQRNVDEPEIRLCPR